jgi:hypothetical protein
VAKGIKENDGQEWPLELVRRLKSRQNWDLQVHHMADLYKGKATLSEKDKDQSLNKEGRA